jgi:hypothetical protein
VEERFPFTCPLVYAAMRLLFEGHVKFSYHNQENERIIEAVVPLPPLVLYPFLQGQNPSS